VFGIENVEKAGPVYGEIVKLRLFNITVVFKDKSSNAILAELHQLFKKAIYLDDNGNHVPAVILAEQLENIQTKAKIFDILEARYGSDNVSLYMTDSSYNHVTVFDIAVILQDESFQNLKAVIETLQESGQFMKPRPGILKIPVTYLNVENVIDKINKVDDFHSIKTLLEDTYSIYNVRTTYFNFIHILQFFNVFINLTNYNIEDTNYNIKGASEKIDAFKAEITRLIARHVTVYLRIPAVEKLETGIGKTIVSSIKKASDKGEVFSILMKDFGKRRVKITSNWVFLFNLGFNIHLNLSPLKDQIISALESHIYEGGREWASLLINESFQDKIKLSSLELNIGGKDQDLFGIFELLQKEFGSFNVSSLDKEAVYPKVFNLFNVEVHFDDFSTLDEFKSFMINLLEDATFVKIPLKVPAEYKALSLFPEVIGGVKDASTGEELFTLLQGAFGTSFSKQMIDVEGYFVRLFNIELRCTNQSLKDDVISCLESAELIEGPLGYAKEPESKAEIKKPLILDFSEIENLLGKASALLEYVQEAVIDVAVSTAKNAITLEITKKNGKPLSSTASWKGVQIPSQKTIIEAVKDKFIEAVQEIYKDFETAYSNTTKSGAKHVILISFKTAPPEGAMKALYRRTFAGFIDDFIKAEEEG
jgi:hypothetical protein